MKPLEQLIKDFGISYVGILADEFKRHSNGEGWVHKDSKVDDRCYIGSNCIIDKGCEIIDVAKVTDDCYLKDTNLSGNVKVQGKCHIYRSTIQSLVRINGYYLTIIDSNITDTARVKGACKLEGVKMVGASSVDGSCVIGKGTNLVTLRSEVHVKGDCKLLNGMWTRSPIGFQLGKYFVSESGLDLFTYGCNTLTYDQFYEYHSFDNEEYQGSLNDKERELWLKTLDYLANVQKELGI